MIPHFGENHKSPPLDLTLFGSSLRDHTIKICQMEEKKNGTYGTPSSIMGVQEEREKIVTENFPNHGKDIGIKIHEAQRTQHKINAKKITIRNIIT